MLTADRDLAANIGVKFQTPEEFFLKADTEPYDHVFEPEQYLGAAATVGSIASGQAEIAISVPFVKNSKQELVIFCGSPGAGKSTFYWDGKSRSTRDGCSQRPQALSCQPSLWILTSSWSSPATTWLQTCQSRHTQDSESTSMPLKHDELTLPGPAYIKTKRNGLKLRQYYLQTARQMHQKSERTP